MYAEYSNADELRARASEVHSRFFPPTRPVVVRVELKRCPDIREPVHGRTWREIAVKVAEKRGIDFDTMMSRTRRYPIVHARHEAFWNIRNHLGSSWGSMAKRFGLDHTSIIHGYHAHAKRREAASA